MQDLTSILKAALGINETCICNPGAIYLSEASILLIVFKIYWSIDSAACSSSTVRIQGGGVLGAALQSFVWAYSLLGIRRSEVECGMSGGEDVRVMVLR